MGTALIYLLVVVVAAAVLFVVAATVFGRGEELAPLPAGVTPTRLPVGAIGPENVRDLRFQQVLRGYRMEEVDWALARLADELERVTAERDHAAALLAAVESGAEGEDA